MTGSSIFLRVCRLVCPVCGKGKLFKSHFCRRERCAHCRWRFERGEGFWVGGSELHMIASYGLSMLVCLPVIFIAGATPLILTCAIAGHVVFSLLAFRYSRAVFIGIDFLLDPGPPPPPDDDRRVREPVRSRPPSDKASRRRPGVAVRTWPRPG